MTNEQMDREVERATRNASKLAALTAEHERASRETSAPASERTQRASRPSPHALRG